MYNSVWYTIWPKTPDGSCLDGNGCYLPGLHHKHFHEPVAFFIAHTCWSVGREGLDACDLSPIPPLGTDWPLFAFHIAGCYPQPPPYITPNQKYPHCTHPSITTFPIGIYINTPPPHPPIYHQVLGFISKSVSFVLPHVHVQNDQTVLG